MLLPKEWSIRWREVHEMAVLDGFGRLSPKNSPILRRRVYLDDLGGSMLDVSGGWVVWIAAPLANTPASGSKHSVRAK